MLHFLLKSRHIDPTRDLELVNMGTDQGAIIAAMRTGRIDGVSFAWPLTMIAEAQNVGKGLIMPAEGDVQAMKGQVQGTIYARPDVIDRREGDLAAFVHADRPRAEALIRSDPARSRGMLKQYNANLSDASIDALFAAYLPTIPNQARVGVASYEKALAFHRSLGFVGPNGNNFGDVVANNVIDRAHALVTLPFLQEREHVAGKLLGDLRRRSVTDAVPDQELRAGDRVADLLREARR